MKYILIDTWNGEGYSNNKALIIEADSFEDALDIAITNATDSAPESEIRIFNGNAATYEYNGNSGAFTVVPYSGQFGICIFPDVNQFQIIGGQVGYRQALLLSCQDKDCDSDDVAEVKEAEEGCLHTSGGCEIFQKLNAFSNMEFLDGGDGTKFEVWKDKTTDEQFQVPIYIERDFVNMKKIDKI